MLLNLVSVTLDLQTTIGDILKLIYDGLDFQKVFEFFSFVANWLASGFAMVLRIMSLMTDMSMANPVKLLGGVIVTFIAVRVVLDVI